MLVGASEVSLQQGANPEAHVFLRMNSPVTTPPWRSSCCNSTAKPAQICSSLVLTPCPPSKHWPMAIFLPDQGVAHSILWCFCFAAWVLWHPDLPYILGDSGSHKPQRKCYGLFKDGILVPIFMKTFSLQPVWWKEGSSSPCAAGFQEETLA